MKTTQKLRWSQISRINLKLKMISKLKKTLKSKHNLKQGPTGEVVRVSPSRQVHILSQADALTKKDDSKIQMGDRGYQGVGIHASEPYCYLKVWVEIRIQCAFPNRPKCISYIAYFLGLHFCWTPFDPFLPVGCEGGDKVISGPLGGGAKCSTERQGTLVG